MPGDAGGRARAWIAGAAIVLVGLALILLGEDVPPPLARGSSAPGFALPDLSSGEVELSELAGRVVLVNFWATWCKPCEEEMPAMERLYDELRGSDFELLAVSVDEDRETVQRFRDRLALTFPILLDPAQRVSNRYQTTGFPESVLIDRRGRVVERYVGPRDWDHPRYLGHIRRLLSEPG